MECAMTPYPMRCSKQSMRVDHIWNPDMSTVYENMRYIQLQKGG